MEYPTKIDHRDKVEFIAAILLAPHLAAMTAEHEPDVEKEVTRAVELAKAIIRKVDPPQKKTPPFSDDPYNKP
jgi:hypothetical protein